METPEYKVITVKTSPTLRYWEDDDTGLIVKRDQPTPVQARHFRSSYLRFALMRNQLLITDGECVFAFKGNKLKITKGDNKNLIEVIEGPELGMHQPIKKEELQKPKNFKNDDLDFDKPIKKDKPQTNIKNKKETKIEPIESPKIEEQKQTFKNLENDDFDETIELDLPRGA